MPSTRDPAGTTFYRLTIDGNSYGDFNSCDGLSLEVQVEQREEGGNNGYVWQLPTRVTFSPITLSRPLTPDSGKLTKWATDVATSRIERPTAQIAALRADGSVVARWGLLDVFPTRWQSSGFGPDSSGVATETVEIVHHGFTDAGGA